MLDIYEVTLDGIYEDGGLLIVAAESLARAAILAEDFRPEKMSVETIRRLPAVIFHGSDEKVLVSYIH